MRQKMEEADTGFMPRNTAIVLEQHEEDEGSQLKELEAKVETLVETNIEIMKALNELRRGAVVGASSVSAGLGKWMTAKKK